MGGNNIYPLAAAISRSSSAATSSAATSSAATSRAATSRAARSSAARSSAASNIVVPKRVLGLGAGSDSARSDDAG